MEKEKEKEKEKELNMYCGVCRKDFIKSGNNDEYFNYKNIMSLECGHNDFCKKCSIVIKKYYKNLDSYECLFCREGFTCEYI